MSTKTVPCETCGGVKHYRAKSCARCAGVGRNCGGPKLTDKGYRRVWAPDHPLARADGMVLEHRKVVHDAGIPIPDGFDVHHKNEDITDNRLENLEVKKHGAHRSDHARAAGFVTNGFGTWPLPVDEEEHRERRRASARAYRARKRAAV